MIIKWPYSLPVLTIWSAWHSTSYTTSERTLAALCDILNLQIMSLLSLENPAVQSYILCSGILAAKVLALGPMTAITRITKGVFINPEDAKLTGGKVKIDDSVERFRRAHLNDLENIPVFWILGALYLTTGPSVGWATLLFRSFAIARVTHTIFYAIIPIPQVRGLGWFVALSINIYMSARVILHYI